MGHAYPTEYIVLAFLYIFLTTEGLVTHIYSWSIFSVKGERKEKFS